MGKVSEILPLTRGGKDGFYNKGIEQNGSEDKAEGTEKQYAFGRNHLVGQIKRQANNLPYPSL
jgi:hypothetical protein